jgi:uncharacterized protein with FMN-binding domain
MTLLGILPTALLSATLMFGGPDMALAQVRADLGKRQYADGVYTATGKYGGQPSFITVTLTLTDGLITAITVKPHAYVPTSLELQRRFAAAVPKVVVGRPLSGLKVGKLAGSSGTPKGFNDALEKIRKQASN